MNKIILISIFKKNIEWIKSLEWSFLHAYVDAQEKCQWYSRRNLSATRQRRSDQTLIWCGIHPTCIRQMRYCRFNVMKIGNLFSEYSFFFYFGFLLVNHFQGNFDKELNCVRVFSCYCVCFFWLIFVVVFLVYSGSGSRFSLTERMLILIRVEIIRLPFWSGHRIPLISPCWAWSNENQMFAIRKSSFRKAEAFIGTRHLPGAGCSFVDFTDCTWPSNGATSQKWPQKIEHKKNTEFIYYRPCKVWYIMSDTYQYERLRGSKLHISCNLAQ